MRRIASALAASVFCFAAVDASAKSVSGVPNGGSYASARKILVKSGWKPVHQPEQGFECMKGDERCEGRPETVNCSGTGVAACIFRWKKKARVIDVIAAGETDPQITGVECRKGC